MQNTIEIKETLATIKDFASNPLSETRCVNLPVGYHIRQGDVYLTKIDKFDRSKYEVSNDHKLAPGSTQGSRHTVDESVTVWRLKNQGESATSNASRNSIGFTVAGPIVESKSTFRLSHPQHAEFLLDAGCYQVTYQVDARTMSAVLD